MKNKYSRIVCNALFVVCLGLAFVGCEGEDGSNGIDGVAGIDGTSGTDGANGLGFEELTQYGAAQIKVVGTSENDVAFTYNAELKFVHNEPGRNDFINNDPNYNFDVVRFLGSPDSHESNSVQFDLVVNDQGLETQSFGFNIDFDTYAISSGDLKYFSLNTDYDHDDTGVSNFDITDYSYDATTGELKYSFSMDIAGANNTTGNDMTVSGSLDVIVLENINGGGGPFPPKK